MTNSRARLMLVLTSALVWWTPLVGHAMVQTSAFTQALAEAASDQTAVAAFYAARDYAPVWTGAADAERRQILLTALDRAPDHGLPVARYDAAALRAAFAAAVTEGDRGRLEVAMTEAYLAYAADLSAGVLVPSKIDGGILREVARPEPNLLMARIGAPGFEGFLGNLAPTAPEYARLMKEKIRLEAQAAAGGFGASVSRDKLEPGDSGAMVVQLRDRLVSLGYMAVSATQTYDRALQAAVQRFQTDSGLNADGVAGASTIAALNIAPEQRLKSVIVAMERMRWLGNAPRGVRHVWVNLPEFAAKIVDNGTVTFQTRAVVGKDVPDRRTPEFSDTMEFMVVNPSWNVPRSITTKEYLPMMQRNPNAAGHLQLLDGNGRVVSRGAVNFGAYTARTFPFSLRQPPSERNALGKVKFMFPNTNNIYLHDTPEKSLFANEVRDFSHGCIRLNEPFDFAYALLARQTTNPRGEFQDVLDTDQETTVMLDEALPVHLVYFTAWPDAKGTVRYMRDVYGRDARIFDALAEAGVVLRGVQG